MSDLEAIGDAVTKSAVAPAATIFNIGDLLGKLPLPRSPINISRTLRNWVDLNQRVGLGLDKKPAALALRRRIES